MKKNDILVVINKLKEISAFASSDLTGLDSYLIFKNGFASIFSAAITISIPFDIGFESAVPVSEFSKFIDKVKDEDLEIFLKDNEILIVSGKIKAGFRLSDVLSEAPELNISGVEKWLKVPEDFREALRICQFSISRDNSHGTVACAYVFPGGVVSSDNVRITERLFGKKATKDFSFFIPRKFVKPIINFQFNKVGHVGGWIHFKADDGSFISLQEVVGEYPKYQEMFNIEGFKIEMPKKLFESLDVISIVDPSEDGNKLIKIHIENNKMSCKAEGSKVWVEEHFVCDWENDPIEFMTSPDFLKDVLNIHNEFVIGENCILIKGDNFKHIMAMIKS